jgi:hypothetical protein
LEGSCVAVNREHEDGKNSSLRLMLGNMDEKEAEGT